jgi:AhpD family alkylhydroperoxidase
MKARIDYTNVPEALRGMYQLEHYIHNSGLEESLVHLMKMRASQINGCAYCLDVHSKDARALGETEQRRPLTPSANARLSRLLTPSPGLQKAMCPTRSSSARERTSMNRS